MLDLKTLRTEADKTEEAKKKRDTYDFCDDGLKN